MESNLVCFFYNCPITTDSTLREFQSADVAYVGSRSMCYLLPEFVTHNLDAQSVEDCFQLFYSSCKNFFLNSVAVKEQAVDL